MATKWAAQAERGPSFGVKILRFVYAVFGRWVVVAVIFPVVIYFFATGARQRRASLDYLERCHQNGIISRRPNLLMAFRHHLSFAFSILDKISAWMGQIGPEWLLGPDVPALTETDATKRGGLIITSHFGNSDALLAIATIKKAIPINVLVHTQHAEGFNDVVRNLASEATVEFMQVTELGIGQSVQLSSAIENGEWVALAGDRLPPEANPQSNVEVVLMGNTVSMPIGPFVLASTLRCPVYFLACIREREGFQVVFTKYTDGIRLTRRERASQINGLAQHFADWIEEQVGKAPYQWFNFYDFWEQPASVASAGDRVSKTEDSSV